MKSTTCPCKNCGSRKIRSLKLPTTPPRSPPKPIAQRPSTIFLEKMIKPAETMMANTVRKIVKFEPMLKAAPEIGRVIESEQGANQIDRASGFQICDGPELACLIKREDDEREIGNDFDATTLTLRCCRHFSKAGFLGGGRCQRRSSLALHRIQSVARGNTWSRAFPMAF